MLRSILTARIQPFFKPDGDGTGTGESDHLQEQEGDNKEVHVDQSKGFKDFNARFSAKERAPVLDGGDVKNKVNQEDVQQRIKDNERIAAERKAEKERNEELSKRIEQNKRPGSNVPNIVEAKRKAEAERDEFKTKWEKYEQEEKPAIEKKIADLEAKIQKGVSDEKEKEYNDKIANLENQLKEKEDTLVNENQILKQRLAFYNLQEDPDFQEKFVKPIQIAYGEAFESLTDDRQRAAFRNALSLNGQILRTTDKEQQNTLKRERDALLDSISEDLKGFSGQSFTTAVAQYIRLSQDHAKALQNHQQTVEEIKEQATHRANKAKADRLASWDKTYKVTKEEYAKDETLSDDEKKLAKELNLDVDKELSEAEAIATNTVRGKGSMTDAIDIIHRGRVYPAMKARIQVLQKQLADRDAVITKLRGAGTEGGNKTTEGQGSGQKKDGEKPSREQWQSKFGASRIQN